MDDAGTRGPELTAVEHAFGLAARMPDRRGRAELLIELARAEFAIGGADHAPEAMSLLERAAEAAKDITPLDVRELVEGRIAVARAAGGDFDGAITAADRIRAKDQRSAVLVEIIAELVKAKDLDRAQMLASHISEDDARQRGWVLVIRGAAESGQIDRAYDLLKHASRPSERAEAQAAIVRARLAKKDLAPAEKMADLIEGAHFKSEALAAVAQTMYRGGNAPRAMKVVRRIESAWIQARTYADLSGIARELKRDKDAVRLFDRARSTAEGITDRVMQASATEDLAERLISWHREDEALALAARSPSKDTIPKVTALVAVAQASEGKLAEAAQTIQRIATDPYWGAQSIAALAEAEARAGADDKGLELTTMIRNVQLRVPAVARVAVLSATHGRMGTDRTPELLARALEIEPPAAQK